MKPEQQVTSLELSKKLKELGVKQESLFRYFDYPIFSKDNLKSNYNNYLSDHTGVLEFNGKTIDGNHPICAYKNVYSAFTVAELGEMLPRGSYSKQTEYKNKLSWEVFTPKVNYVNGFQTQESEADARAKCLIYLIENNLIKIK